MEEREDKMKGEKTRGRERKQEEGRENKRKGGESRGREGGREDKAHFN